MGRRRRRASPLNVDDLLAEILLRLPTLSTSLPCASLVCARWHHLVTPTPSSSAASAPATGSPSASSTPASNRGASISPSASSPIRHRAPSCMTASLCPRAAKTPAAAMMSTPGMSEAAATAACSSSTRRATTAKSTSFWYWLDKVQLGVLTSTHDSVSGVAVWLLVWNPLAGEQHFLGVPHSFDSDQIKFSSYAQAAVICASGDKGSFKVALAWNDGRSAHVCFYSSETGVWGDVVSAAVQSESAFVVVGSRNVLFGNSLYWIQFSSQLRILQFDLGSQKLAVIEVPLPSNAYANHCGICLTTLARGGGLSLLVMAADLRSQLWERTESSDGVGRWMLGRTIDLDMLLSLRSQGFPECGVRGVFGIDGDHNVMFVLTYRGVFMVHLKLMQFEKVFEANSFRHNENIHPFMNLYDPGNNTHLRCKYTKSLFIIL
nr:unnamed protein product [Digitaria exilis]